MRIAIVSRDEKKGFNGPTSGRAVAVKVVGGKLTTRIPGVSCGWAGNLGFGNAVAAVRVQLNAKFGKGEWVEAQFDEAGDLVA